VRNERVVMAIRNITSAARSPKKTGSTTMTLIKFEYHPARIIVKLRINTML